MCITFGLAILSGKETSGNPQQPSNTTLPKPTQCREFKNPKIGDPTKAPIRPICGDPSPTAKDAGGFDPRDSGQGFCSFQKEDPLYSTLPALPYVPETRPGRCNCYGYRTEERWPTKTCVEKIQAKEKGMETEKICYWVEDSSPNIITSIKCCKKGEDPQVTTRIQKFNALLSQLETVKGYTEVMQVADRAKELPPWLSKICSAMREIVDPILRETLNDLRFKMAMPHCAKVPRIEPTL